ncbi:MAG: M28 family peptidase [Gemmatimonadota bacterium]|nr:M28 family peptidase [Gemmatimonadota bacterium]
MRSLVTPPQLTLFTSRSAGTLLAAVVGLALAMSAWILTPPTPADADADEAEFSAGRSIEILGRLIGDESPHPIGSAANARVRDALVREVEALGLEPSIQSTFVCGEYRHYCGTVENVVARIPALSGPVDPVGGTGAVLINAHYDSQGATPGAADALAGVASALEVGRVVAGSDDRARDVILFFPDGEEAGLLGATAFVQDHPWAADVEAFVNLEARGSGGISIPAYTIGDDRQVLRPYARGLGRHAPGSGLAAVSTLLPAANDIVVFDQLGVPGVTFGFTSHIRHYHTPLDDLEHLDRGSVQQQGDAVLRVVRELVASPADAGAARGRLSFVSVGPLTLSWPERWAVPLALIALAGTLTLVAVAIRRGVVAGRRLAWGLVAWPTALVVAFFGSAVLNLVRKSASLSPGVWISRPDPTFFGFWAGAALLVAACAWLFRRGARPGGLWLGAWIWWAICGLAVSWAFPGLGYLFVAPTLAAAAFGLGGLLRPHGATPLAPVLPAIAASAFVALLVWLPHVWFLKDFIGLGNMPPVAAMVAIALTTAMPLAAALPRPGHTVTGLAIAALVLLGVGTRMPAFSEEAPQWANVVYSLDADAAEARWFFTGSPLPEAVVAAGGFAGEFGRVLPWTPGESGPTAEAPDAGLPAPELEVIEPPPEQGEPRRARVRIRSVRGAPVVQIAFEADRAPDVVRLGGVRVPEDRAAFALFDPDYRVFTVWTVPDSGVVAELEWTGSGPLPVLIADRSPGVPEVARRLVEARPAAAVPIGAGDATVVHVRRELP